MPDSSIFLLKNESTLSIFCCCCKNEVYQEEIEKKSLPSLRNLWLFASYSFSNPRAPFGIECFSEFVKDFNGSMSLERKGLNFFSPSQFSLYFPKKCSNSFF